GRLGPSGSDAPIAVVSLDQPAIATEGQSIADLRRSDRHRAIVAITKGGRPGLCPSNARAFLSPFGVPVLQIDSDEESAVGDLIQSGAGVTLVVDAVRTSSRASNVVATVEGRRPSLAPLVVMTPRSGWWQCASERGGGIACWLEAMRRTAAARPLRP